MRRWARRTGVLFLVACVCAGSSPCLAGAEALKRAEPCGASVHDVSPPEHAGHPARAAERGVPEAARHELRAPCPCGCCELPDVGASAARTGYALPSALPRLAIPLALRAAAASPERARSAHGSPLEHVPLHC